MEDIWAVIGIRKDLENFYAGNFEQVKNPATLLEKVLNLDELNRYDREHGEKQSRKRLEFEDHATELEMMEKVRAILSFYELKGPVEDNSEDNRFKV